MQSLFRSACLAALLLASVACSDRLQSLKTSCPPGQENCDGKCVDLASNPDHCGACGRLCPAAMVCSEGSCAAECSGELTLCGRSCVDLSSDDRNCGGCSFACQEGISCNGGSCACPAGTFACDGVCTVLEDDPENCGACGKSCAGGLCEDGACSCLEGMTLCNGACVNLEEDSANCGSCGRACADGARCTEGTCPCPEGLTDCGGDAGCVDLNTEQGHCGACGNDCGDAPCMGGTCFCNPGTTFCDGLCVELESDHEHCGACGRSCLDRPNSSAGICGAGQCYFVCTDGYDDCDGDPATGCETRLLDDVQHCGACNHDCRSLPNTQNVGCKDWTCSFTCAPGWGDCDGDPNNGCETNLLTTAPHCGGCGNVCEGPCSAGKCTEPVQLSAGGMHNCVTTTDGSVYCWGNNDRGQRGPDAGDAFFAGRVHGVEGVKHVEAGGFFTCALLKSGEVSCWGDGKYGQLGDGTTTPRSQPAKVPELNQVVQLSASGANACAVRSNGELFCWGANDYGQMGNGTTQNALSPIPVDLGGRKVVKAFAGRTTCVLTESKRVMCWGLNHAGQVGDGTTEDRHTPYLIPGVENVKDLHLGHGNTTPCLILESGELQCWGSNGWGAVGDGTREDRMVPTTVVDLEDEVVVGIGSGGTHTCAYFASGKAKCWGYNSSGQVGNGTWGSQEHEVRPVYVQDLEDVVEMDGGNWHSCARLASGKIMCWGHIWPARLPEPPRSTAPGVSGPHPLEMSETTIRINRLDPA